MSRIPALEKLLKSSGDEPDPDVLYMLAQEHMKIGSHDQAVAWYDRCIGASPNYTYAYYHKALALDGAGKRAAGVETLRAGLTVAKQCNDRKALGEIGSLLDEWT